MVEISPFLIHITGFQIALIEISDHLWPGAVGFAYGNAVSPDLPLHQGPGWRVCRR